MSSIPAIAIGPAGRRADAGRDPRVAMMAGGFVVASVIFNALLAIANGHLITISGAHVVAAEMLIVLGSYMLILHRFSEKMIAWFVLVLVLILIFCLRGVATDSAELKFVRDCLVIPTFVMLGLTFDKRYLGTLFIVTQSIVILVMLFEALQTSSYSNLFQIQSYYIDTRGYDIENFWNKESDLFVSAVRPVARFIPGLELHRLSSVFLEPVTLGNYCATVTAFLCACFNRLSRTAFFYLAITNVVALVGCDGRLALIATVPMVAAAMSARHLPRYSSFVYLPTFIALAVAVTYLGGFVGGQDDIMGRLAYSRELLARFDAVELLGISNRFLSEAVDSGIAYLTITQSMFGALAMWLFITLGSDESTLEEKRYKHAISLYFALALLVSFSIFSIKTGALMWFTFGSLQRANETN